MTDIVPTIGRIVWYMLSEYDAVEIRRRRTSHVGLHGNRVCAGEVFPAQIVKVWGGRPDSYVNLQVMLDGNDTYWATSRPVGAGNGTYQWMPYQIGQAAKTEAAEKKADKTVTAGGRPTPTFPSQSPSSVDCLDGSAADMRGIVVRNAEDNGYKWCGRSITDGSHLFQRGTKRVWVYIRDN